jgi:hypothetical protein
MWFFAENPNGWSPAPQGTTKTSWYAIDFKQERNIGAIELYFFSDAQQFQAPAAIQLQYQTPAGWKDIPQQRRTPQQSLANGENRIECPAVHTQELRIVFTNPPAPATIRLIELKAFASQ